MVWLKWILLRSSKAVSLTAIVLHPDTGSTRGPQEERNGEFLFKERNFSQEGWKLIKFFFHLTICSYYI
jgi:hypothetical protein